MTIVDHGQFFSREELQCRCGECGYLCKMDETFMMYLEELREKFSKPLYLSSGFRCPAHNRKVSSSGSPNGPHTTGKAVDILIAKQDGYEIFLLLNLFHQMLIQDVTQLAYLNKIKDLLFFD